VFMLILEKISVLAVAGTTSEKSPSALEVVPIDVPFTRMETLPRGTPLSSVVFPVMVLFWARESKGNRIAHSKSILFMCSVLSEVYFPKATISGKMLQP
jgi:hypothetical protein